MVTRVRDDEVAMLERELAEEDAAWLEGMNGMLEEPEMELVGRVKVMNELGAAAGVEDGLAEVTCDEMTVLLEIGSIDGGTDAETAGVDVGEVVEVMHEVVVSPVKSLMLSRSIFVS